VRDQQFYTRSLIESNIDALIAIDPRGIIMGVNKQMEALTGCRRDELIGAPFKDEFTDPERADTGIKLVLGESKLTDYELTARARDGKETVADLSASSGSGCRCRRSESLEQARAATDTGTSYRAMNPQSGRDMGGVAFRDDKARLWPAQFDAVSAIGLRPVECFVRDRRETVGREPFGVGPCHPDADGDR
jgi:PAS domain S-box-containing protein